ncbi:Uncharacterised protein [Mycobacteroides abscessus subsp. abscessus]|nr:Uncharacterised protein [Mycobacteroides abscessus subsp. abscessus]
MGRPLPGVVVGLVFVVVTAGPPVASAVDSAVASVVPAWPRRKNFTFTRLFDVTAHVATWSVPGEAGSASARDGGKMGNSSPCSGVDSTSRALFTG